MPVDLIACPCGGVIINSDQVLFANQTDATAKKVLQQPDGKLLVVGTSFSATAPYRRMTVARLNPDGNFDSTFGTNGVFTGNSSSNSNGQIVTTAALQSDGSIVVGGYEYAVTTTKLGLIRLLPNGTFDSSFDGDGKKQFQPPPLPDTPFTTPEAAVEDVVIQPNGKLLVTTTGAIDSSYPDWLPLDVSIERDLHVARLNADGSSDSSFDADGWVQVPEFGGSFRAGAARAATLRPDGKFVIAGAGYRELIVTQFNGNGSPDATFGTANAQQEVAMTLPSIDDGFAVAVQPDGRIVIAGATDARDVTSLYDDQKTNSLLLRYDGAGTIDTSLDGERELNEQANGRLVIDSGYPLRSLEDLRDVAIRPNGEMLLAGRHSNSMTRSAFDRHGELIAQELFGGSEGSANAVAIRPDGTAVFVGTVDNTMTAVAAPVPNLTPAVVLADSGTGAFEDVAVQADGKVVVGGWATVGNVTQPIVTRFHPNGSRDSTFATAGTASLDWGGTNDRAMSVALQADGKILVGGFSSNGGTSTFAVTRLNVDGSLDSTFDGDGLVTTSFGAVPAAGKALALQPDGKIVLVGDDVGVLRVVRYLPYGSLDPTFDGDGIVSTDASPNSLNEIAQDVVLLPDGSMLVTGSVKQADGRSDVVIVKYRGDAALTAPSVLGISNDTGRNDRDGVTNDQTLTIYGVGVASSTVSVFRNGTLLGTTIANGSGQWSYDNSAETLPHGSYVFTVQATLGAFTSDVSFGFTVTIDD